MPAGHDSYQALAARAPTPSTDTPDTDAMTRVEQCSHESCSILDQRLDEPDSVVVLAECDDCPAVVSWRSTPGRHGERVGLQVESLREGA